MKLQLQIDGNLVNVDAQKMGTKLWVHHNGNNFCVDLEEASGSKSRKKKHHGAHTGEVLAPMPGKVTKIFKADGENVKKGEALIVMEAMKMEYTLKAEGNGTVLNVSCSVGDQVVLGKLLMKIKPEAENG